MTHRMPFDDILQGFFIKIIGYHCPFTTWAFEIDEKYEINEWLVNKNE